MKLSHKTLLISLALGLFLWLIDGVLDYFVFYAGHASFARQLLVGANYHEVYVRVLGVALFLAFGTYAYRQLRREKETKSELQEKAHELEERTKEMRTVYRMGEVVEEPDATLDDILQGVVNAIPAGWQYPGITGARITLRERTYCTGDEPGENGDSIRETVIVDGEPAGLIEVWYEEERPEEDDGPFLKEERDLLAAICERLGRIVERYDWIAALRRSEERFRKVVVQSPFPVFVHAEEGEILTMSESIENITGYDLDQFQTLVDWIHTVYDEETAERALEEGLALYERQEQVHHGEWPVPCADGSIRIWDFLSAPLPPLTDGRRAAITMAADVTERERARDRVQHLNDLLRTINAVNELIVREKDRDALIQEACQVLVSERGFHYAWMVVLGEEGNPLTLAHSGLDEHYEELTAAMESGQVPPCVERVTSETRTFFHDDPSQCTGCPVREAHGNDWPVTLRMEYGDEVMGALSVCMAERMRADDDEIQLLEELAGDLALALYNIDLETERDQLEGQLRQAQKLQAVGQLAGGIAHDFNNILTGILGYVQLTLRSEELPRQFHADLEQVERLGQRASELTGQLLAFSRQQTLEPQVVDLNNLVADMSKMLDRLLGENIELEFKPAEDLGNVHVDPGRIEQVIMNLAVNAQDAMPEGGVLTIETANETLDAAYAEEHIGVAPGDYVRIAVSDTGVGMDRETRSRAFEPFFTTKKPGSGTGLGLSTCYGIVKQHGGNIWLYSEPDEGTTFKIYLPRSERTPKYGREQIETDGKGTETILLVEDEPSVLSIAGRILTTRGYEVLSAEEGQEALAVFRDHEDEIDLLLTDVILPDMNGRELYDKLQERRPGLKVLFMSGYTDNAIVHHGVLDADVEFMQKPFTPAQVSRRVREVLEG